MKIYLLTGIEKFDHTLSMFDNHLNFTNKTTSTRKTYTSCLRQFMLNSGKLPEECSKKEIISHFINLKEKRKINHGSLKLYLSAIKYHLLHVAERIDLWEKIPNPKIKKYTFEVLNVNEIKTLFEACRDPKERFIIQILFETGIRSAELLKLKISDFDFYNNSICIRNSKNNKTRIVYFGDNFVNTFNEYFNASKTLFTESKSNIEFNRFIPYSKRSVRLILRKIALRCGVNKRVNPHSFRHAFAVHYLNFGGTLYQLQRVLGHSCLTTTCCYLQYASITEIKKISVLDKVIESKQHPSLNLKIA